MNEQINRPTDLWDSRMHHLVQICANHHFSKDKSSSPRRHFLTNFRVRRDKRVDTLAFTTKRGQETLVRYNLAWLKEAVNDEGSFTPTDNVDEICKMITDKTTAACRRT
jgi:hypothetical protein